MNYTVSKHSKINAKINFNITIILSNDPQNSYKLDHLRRIISETTTETDRIEMWRNGCLLYDFEAK